MIFFKNDILFDFGYFTDGKNVQCVVCTDQEKYRSENFFGCNSYIFTTEKTKKSLMYNGCYNHTNCYDFLAHGNSIKSGYCISGLTPINEDTFLSKLDNESYAYFANFVWEVFLARTLISFVINSLYYYLEPFHSSKIGYAAYYVKTTYKPDVNHLYEDKPIRLIDNMFFTFIKNSDTPKQENQIFTYKGLRIKDYLFGNPQEIKSISEKILLFTLDEKEIKDNFMQDNKIKKGAKRKWF